MKMMSIGQRIIPSICLLLLVLFTCASAQVNTFQANQAFINSIQNQLNNIQSEINSFLLPPFATPGQFVVENASQTAYVAASLSQDATASIAVPGQITVTGLQTVPICNTAPVSGQSLVYGGTNWCPQNPAATGLFPIQAFKGECNFAGDGRPYAPTTVTATSGNPVVTVASATGFIKGGGIWLKHGSTVTVGTAPSAPTVTAVTKVTGETHTVSPNTGVATFSTSSNWVEDYALRTNISGTSLFRINPADSAATTYGQYYITPPAFPGTATYNVQTSTMTTPVSTLNSVYWTPDNAHATSYCYEITFEDAEDGLTAASSGGCTTTGNATLDTTHGVVVRWAAPPAGAVAVGIYRSTDGGATYSLYWAQPLAETTISGNYGALQKNTFVDLGSAIGPYFSPPIVDNNFPATPPVAALADDLHTTISSITGTSITVAAAPQQNLSGTMALTEDTQALHDVMIAAANVGGGVVQIPIGCRIDYLNGHNFSDLYTSQKANGILLQGTKRYITNGGAHIYIDGTGNGACSFLDNTHGGLELYFNVMLQDLQVSTNDNGSTNYSLACLYSNGDSHGNGSTNIKNSGNGGGGISSLQANKPNAPNAVGMVISGNTNIIEAPLLVRLKQDILAAGNNLQIRGPGDVGFPFQPKYPLIEIVAAGSPFVLHGVTMENGPNFLLIHGSVIPSGCSVTNDYLADAPPANSTAFDDGDLITAEIGTSTLGFAGASCNISSNLIEGGLNGLVIAGTGSKVESNTFYGLTGGVNALFIMDATGGNYSNNKIDGNFFMGAAYSGSDIVDYATIGQDDIGVDFFLTAATGHSVDFTNCTESGTFNYNSTLDTTVGYLDTNSVIPKRHRLFTFGNNSNAQDTVQNILMGSGFFDKPITTPESGGGTLVINPTTGNTQIVTFADNSATTIGGITGLTTGQRWTLLLSNSTGAPTGALTFTTAFTKDATAPTVVGASSEVQCQATVTSAKQSFLGPCTTSIAFTATPTASPTPTATPTMSPTATTTTTPTGTATPP